jgi:hemin uptake protein HemP
LRTSQAFNAYLQISREGWLTKRDVQVLHLLHKFRFMSLRQIARLFFPTARWTFLARRRLLKLYKYNLIDRFRPPYNGGAGTSEYVYTLNHVGAYILAANTAREVSDLGWRPNERMGQMMHCLECAEVYTRLKRAERLFKRAKMRYVPEPTQTVSGQTLRPDAYVVVQHRGKEYRWFIEVDMGTEWKNKITTKVQAYEGIKGCPPVVFVVQEVARIKQLREWVEPLRKKVKVLYCTKRGLIKTLRRSL